MYKFITTTLLALLGQAAWAQHPYTPVLKEYPIDTFYYHFYNGVQLIEINDFRKQWAGVVYSTELEDIEYSMKSSVPPRWAWQLFLANPPHSSLIFRNQKGEILHTYNLDSTQIKQLTLPTPEALEGKTIAHLASRVNEWNYMPTDPLPQTTGFYRIYVKQPNLKQILVGLVDSLGKMVVSPQYSKIDKIGNWYKVVSPDGNATGLLNAQFKELLPMVYQDIMPYNYSLNYLLMDEYSKLKPYWILKKDNKYGLYDLQEQRISIPTQYDGLNLRADGYCTIVLDGKYGVANCNGKLLSSCIFDRAVENFSEGLARICNRDKGYGFMDDTGKIIIPTQYDHAGNFKDGKTWVQLGNKRFFINTKGEEIKE